MIRAKHPPSTAHASTTAAPARRTRAATVAGRTSTARIDFVTLWHTDAMQRIETVRQGVPASWVQALAHDLAIPKERLYGSLGLARATVDRRARENLPLSPDDSAKVLGMARLVGQVQAMVEESGDPSGFDAPAWVSHWLDRPLPALDGRRPVELLDTPDGQRLVSDLLTRLQSGAYA